MTCKILSFNCVTNPIPGLWQEMHTNGVAVNFPTLSLADGPDGLAMTCHPYHLKHVQPGEKRRLNGDFTDFFIS